MGVGCHLLLQGIFPTQGSNPCLLHLLRWQGGFFTTEPPQKQPPPPLRWLLSGSVDLSQSYPPTALSRTPPVPSKYVNVAHTAPALFEQKHFFIMKYFTQNPWDSPRIQEWVVLPYSRGSSQPGNGTHLSSVSLHWQVGSLPLALPGKPIRLTCTQFFKKMNVMK